MLGFSGYCFDLSGLWLDLLLLLDWKKRWKHVTSKGLFTIKKWNNFILPWCKANPSVVELQCCLFFFFFLNVKVSPPKCWIWSVIENLWDSFTSVSLTKWKRFVSDCPEKNWENLEGCFELIGIYGFRYYFWWRVIHWCRKCFHVIKEQLACCQWQETKYFKNMVFFLL